MGHCPYIFLLLLRVTPGQLFGFPTIAKYLIRICYFENNIVLAHEKGTCNTCLTPWTYLIFTRGLFAARAIFNVITKGSRSCRCCTKVTALIVSEFTSRESTPFRLEIALMLGLLSEV